MIRAESSELHGNNFFSQCQCEKRNKPIQNISKENKLIRRMYLFLG